ncbi:hypothetical protein [Emcibacter nanhaiensis]|uniref:Uncharacterized protein n=1 Tax=Emcibacter nanhaiensis TaxID=1505037 RepID=A0A501PCS4_9PROT|nr:hypothetical protein [Emcibacter nanhaiensis]TPD57704.1 hypothetical protein FIV46_16510 [Emcibacter nanhaiensis]
MQVFEMVVLIVLIVFVASIIKQWLKAKQNGGKINLDDLAHDLGLADDYYSKQQIKPYLDRIEGLEERIKVLERIVTDKSHNLAQEIDKLK